MKFSVTKKDFEVTWFAGTGKGGQKKNKAKVYCRLKHKDTGIITTGQVHRERSRNQKLALENMANNKFFRAYCEQKLRELEDGETVEEWLDKQMEPANILVQIKNEEGKWVDEERNKIDGHGA